ncbi:hypothetical protein [Flavisolibacter nicotianae]|uniref:hypothetical protein n=1 Tax=Flavisolibacter nicotianae TaxID=2364882 RepID=UPI000EAD8646|nr:hypothetical protein [Flavisolibacter nicotianae]
MVQQDPAQNNQRFESDTQKIVRKHLSDPNHVITDEEIANVRIGMTPSADVPTQQALEESEDRIADRKADSEDETMPGAQKSTPWDVLE